MNVLTALLTGASVLAYAAALALIATRRWNAYAGWRPLNIAAVLAFAIARIYPQSIVAAMLASIVFACALFVLARRSTFFGALLAAVPLLAMLLTVDRAFFPGSTAQDFQSATLALLCIPGPVALAAWLISLSQRKPNYPTTSAR